MKGLTPIIHPNAGCDYHRIYLPLKHMGIDIASFEGKKFRDVMAETKVLFFNRKMQTNLDKLLELRKQYGFKIVVDLDDFWLLHPRHVLYNTWEMNKTGEIMKRFAEIADAVTVTTSLLADKVKSVNKNVHVFPNALPYGIDQFTDVKEECEFTRFLYAGGGSHFWDIQELTVPFTKANNNPAFNKAQFILCGYHIDPNFKSSQQEWEKIERKFNLNGKLKNYVRRYTYPLHDYMAHYEHADICVIPLETNNFNRFKSNLKFLEAGCKYIPCIASYAEPYSNEPNKDVVMFARNAREWYEHLEYCVKNPTFVKEKGLELGQYVRENYDIFKVNEGRKQFFEHLMS